MRKSLKMITLRTNSKKLKTYWLTNFTSSFLSLDNEYETTVIKSFTYVIKRRAKTIAKDVRVDVIMCRDTNTKKEFFRFQAAGEMLVADNKFVATFTHTLTIKLNKIH